MKGGGDVFLVVIDTMALIAVVAAISYICKLDPWLCGFTLFTCIGMYGLYLVFKTLLSRMIVF